MTRGSGGGRCSVYCGGGRGDGIMVWAGSRLITTLTTSSYLSGSLLVLFVIVSVAESVPTVVGGQKEVVVMSGRSLYWPYAFPGDTNSNGHHGGGGGGSLTTEKRNNVQPIQLCGYRLLEAVRGICRGNYVGFSRRSDPDMEDDEHMMMDYKGERSSSSSHSPPSPPHRHHPHRHQNGNRHRPQHLLRFRRNIIDECCMKPCSVNEMLRYCGRT